MVLSIPAKIGAFVALILLLTSEVFAGQATLSWSPSTSSSIAGYNVYYGQTSGSYSSKLTVPNQTSYVVTGLTEGATYYFVVTARDSSGAESGSSNQASFTIPTSSTSPTTSTAPVPNFSGSPTSGTAPLTVAFTGGATGTVSSYSWNFGDGTSSALQSPSHSYSSPGNYTVALTATGSGGSNTVVRSSYINVASSTTTTPTTTPTTNLFTDNFTRTTLSPWVGYTGTWSISNGILQGRSAAGNYGYAYYNPSGTAWTDYQVSGQIQFPGSGGFGGGLGGRLNPSTGAHYAAWIYPEGSPGGSSVLKLVKFRGWTNWSGTPMQQVSLPGVGTSAHTLSVIFQGTRIRVLYDGKQVMDVTDNGFDGSAAYASGGINAGMWTYQTSYTMNVDNVAVTPVTTTTAQSLFTDDFSRTALSPWLGASGTWSLVNGALQGSSAVGNYGYAYYSPSGTTWGDYQVSGQVQFPNGGYGGGLGGRLNPATGEHYGAWIFPEGSAGGSSVLKLVKFNGWTSWSGTPMQQVSLPGVGTTAHTLTLVFQSNRIQVLYDGSKVIDVTDNGFDGRTAYLTGGISSGMWTYQTPYTMNIDNIRVM